MINTGCGSIAINATPTIASKNGAPCERHCVSIWNTNVLSQSDHSREHNFATRMFQCVFRFLNSDGAIIEDKNERASVRDDTERLVRRV